MKINKKILIKDIHFPPLKPIKTDRREGFFGKVKDFVTYRRKFKLLKNWAVYCKSLDRFIFMPKGFIVDGASVPKILNLFYSSTGVLFYGSFPHDFGYRYTGLFIVMDGGEIVFRHYKKSELDKIFLDICSQENNMPIVSTVATIALAIFGFLGWRSNRKQNNDINIDYSQYCI